MTQVSAISAPTHPHADFRLGIALVAGAALTWSFGGTIARFLSVTDPWTVVFWRASFSAAFLLLFMLVAAPLARYIPLAALAGVLVVVSWNMAEKEEFAILMHNWRTALILLATFGLTLFIDLTTGIVAGCVMAALFAITQRDTSKEHG